MRLFILALTALIFQACSVTIPEGIKPIENFKLNAYLGTWYEIARMDHSFERSMQKVSANYTLREDGGVRVLNKGFKDQQWKEAEGKAYFVSAPNIGHLKVSFFGPFYGSYAIFTLDKDYRYAFIAGDTRDYLWFLSRTPTVSQALKDAFVKQIQALGYDAKALIWVDQQ